MLLAIDPGNDTGWALFENGMLIDAGLYFPPLDGAIMDLVIERPTIYPRSKARPADIVTLAINAGMHAGRASSLTSIHWVEPRTWKGQVRKKIHHSRIVKLLSEDEKCVLRRLGVTEGKAHNVLDAVGLGLWKLGRS